MNQKILAENFCAKIGWNGNFIMQMAYGDKKTFYKFFSFVIEKIDFPVKMPQEKEVLWIYSFWHVWNIFILPFLNTLGYTLFKKYCVLPRHFRLELLPFSRPVHSFRSYFRIVYWSRDFHVTIKYLRSCGFPIFKKLHLRQIVKRYIKYFHWAQKAYEIYVFTNSMVKSLNTWIY